MQKIINELISIVGSKVKLAEKLNVSRVTIWSWSTGKANVTSEAHKDNIRKLAKK